MSLMLVCCGFDDGSRTPMFDFTNVNGGTYAYVANPYSVVPPPEDKLNNKVNKLNPPRDLLKEGWGNCWVLFDQRFTGVT